jgi:hypothetical protein
LLLKLPLVRVLLWLALVVHCMLLLLVSLGVSPVVVCVKVSVVVLGGIQGLLLLLLLLLLLPCMTVRSFPRTTHAVVRQ